MGAAGLATLGGRAATAEGREKWGAYCGGRENAVADRDELNRRTAAKYALLVARHEVVDFERRAPKEH